MDTREHNSHKLKKVISSIKWLIFWIGLAFLFNILIYFWKGSISAQEFLGGYLTELSLSIDNVFVFLMIFKSFQIPEKSQHRVLSYGIVGAIVLRFVFILFGITLINAFEWMIYVFGAFLIIQGIKMTFPEKESDPHDSFIIKTVSRIFPTTDGFRGDRFLVIENGKRMITPLLAVIFLIEGSDIIFAIDSVPAVLSISTDIFVVYTSNIFAILGLRQLFFVIEHMSERFEYVKYGVALILIFTGIKMLGGVFGIHIATNISILVIASLLVVSIIVSMIVSKVK